MKLAILRHAGTPDRKLLGLVDEENEAVLRGEWTPETPPGEPELPPDDAPEYQSFVRSAAVKHAQAVARNIRITKAADEDPEEPDDDEPASVILEQPAELYSLIFIGQSPVDRNRSTGAVVNHVELLPYDHEQSYLDGGVGVTILELPRNEADADPGNPVIADYLRALHARWPNTPRGGDGPRRRMIDRTSP